MSHCFGAKCETHRVVIVEDRCPERGCDGRGHGYTYVACSERCPEHQSREPRFH